ncbi:hypothetical protein PIB30_063151 [Stylosanthes scabra]|uniref:Uncharacterized protein n=1 Tax=Stylosanthes scabra TaxID=79078 RepID=A0ABU6UKW8_9FABA|nr:hypothetical protein [Stylosanthes scabra]
MDRIRSAGSAVKSPPHSLTLEHTQDPLTHSLRSHFTPPQTPSPVSLSPTGVITNRSSSSYRRHLRFATAVLVRSASALAQTGSSPPRPWLAGSRQCLVPRHYPARRGISDRHVTSARS